MPTPIERPAVAQSWTVGTDRSCDVRVSGDQYVSAYHCRVDLLADGTYTVTDLGATNAARIRRGTGTAAFTIVVRRDTPILPGDTLIIGRSEIPRGR